MKVRLYPGLVAATAVMFVGAPILIVGAPYESTMGLIQKIFYFHVPSWIMMFLAVFVCGIASAIYLFKEKPAADHLAVATAELAVLFGLMGLTTGPLWAIKAWGVWWQWDPRLTMALILELIFVSYMLLRAYGGPGSEKLAAGLALFGMANVPFVYISVNIWRTIHPGDERTSEPVGVGAWDVRSHGVVHVGVRDAVPSTGDGKSAARGAPAAGRRAAPWRSTTPTWTSMLVSRLRRE